MPKTSKSGDAKKSKLPYTLQKSDEKDQRTIANASDPAIDQYNDAERAHRTAYDALKHTHEKVGNHWEPKSGGSGPSDEHSAGGKNTNRNTAGGVDKTASKEHLYEQAQKLEISGRSNMNKDELIEALEKESNRRTSKSS